jgi:ribonuclease BN (tRNA processing enzyme)
MRLTVVGSGTSQPQPETPASGLLIETETTAVLVDCGQGIIRELMGIRDPRELDAIVIGHMHADHYIDLVSLRYLLPWEGVASAHIPVLLPPGGKTRLDALATAVSERPTFFDDAYSILEYDPAHRLHIGDVTISFVAITGDTGPNEGFAAAARGAELFVAEATLADSRFDDPRRGHLTAEEAIEMADQAGSEHVVLVHFRAELMERIERACAARPGAMAGRPGLSIEVQAGPRAAPLDVPAPAGGATSTRPTPRGSDSPAEPSTSPDGLARAPIN